MSDHSLGQIKYLVFDYDTFIYRCGFASQSVRYAVCTDSSGVRIFDSMRELRAELGPEVPRDQIYKEIIPEPVENALHSLKIAVQSCLEKFRPEEYDGYLSTGRETFRDKLATVQKYKGNRDPTYKPHWYRELREYAESRFNAKTVKRIEADDAVAISACTRPGGCIVSNDKDLDQIPGWHYNWTKPELGPGVNPTDSGGNPYWVSKADGLKHFYRQCLSGDPTDNIPGLPGVGPRIAERILKGAKGPLEAETRILEKYVKEYGPDAGRERFIETARLVYILRRPEEVNKLWEPMV